MYFPAMEKLPAEILARICQFACTDGGKNAGSLRLVSRGICEIANLHRFRAISVSGVVAIESLIDTLKRSSPEPIIIEHLFVSDKPRTHATDRFSRPPEAGENTLKNKIREQIFKVNTTEAQQLEYSLVTLMGYAAPKLRSLTMMLYNPCHSSSFGIFASDSFPNLTNLALRYPAWVDSSGWLLYPVDMPALRLVTLSVDRSLLSVSVLIQRLAERCGSLDNIVIQGVHPDSHVRAFAQRIVDERGLPEAPPTALINFDFYPVNPDPFSRDNLIQQALKRFMREAEHFADEDCVRIHSLADHAPEYEDWREYWRRQVNEHTS
jgi:hypothetical protein